MCVSFLFFFFEEKEKKYDNFLVNNNQKMGSTWIVFCVLFIRYRFNLMHSWKVKFPLKSHIFQWFDGGSDGTVLLLLNEFVT